MAGSRSPILNVMSGAAKRVGRFLVRDYGEVDKLQVSIKGPGDFVSSADRKVDNTLRELLGKARPDWGFLTEEGDEVIGRDPDNRWIIDPLDGTTNFLHGLPHFCISIAHQRGREVVAGVVYDPLRDETFAAEKGAGAYLNDSRLRVSARRDLAKSVLATGIPTIRSPDTIMPFMKQLVTVTGQVSAIRRFGSPALDLAYVAAGRFDGYWEADLRPWDMAAGLVLVREAGGFVTDLTGGGTMLESGDVLATNPELHRPVMKLLETAARLPDWPQAGV
ncbi:MAG: inositol monophosphatase family protein [Proteobacteria bacterium]|nr:inositol monophosphatase family protein [Pseudomonadota bacterium]MDA1058980.1 inositol monophosphatase family protein [Pseudomonadota bacterium]